jgi:hypothetical protein
MYAYTHTYAICTLGFAFASNQTVKNTLGLCCMMLYYCKYMLQLDDPRNYGGHQVVGKLHQAHWIHRDGQRIGQGSLARALWPGLIGQGSGQWSVFSTCWKIEKILGGGFYYMYVTQGCFCVWVSKQGRGGGVRGWRWRDWDVHARAGSVAVLASQ